MTSERTRYFVNTSAGGFSGVVDEKLTPEIKLNWGPLAYLRSAAAALPVQSRPGMWFNADGELVGNEPIVFQILPRALDFIVNKR
jgi:diacylglycerol kinase family enzyme